MKKSLLQPLWELPAFQTLTRLMSSGGPSSTLSRAHEPLSTLQNASGQAAGGKSSCLLADGVLDSQRVHLAAGIIEKLERPALFVTYSEIRAREIYEDLHYFMPEAAAVFPSKDILFYYADVRSGQIAKQRFSVMSRLLKREPVAVVLSVEALFDLMTPPQVFGEYVVKLSPGMNLDIAEFAKTLVYMGYERTDMMDGPGQFAIRGGIVDIYSPLYETAVRLELWGDEIDSIRRLDSSFARSTENIDLCEVFPMRDLVYGEETLEAAIERIEEELSEACFALADKGLHDERDSLQAAMEPVVERLREERTFSGIERFTKYFYDEHATLLDYFDNDTLIFVDEPDKVREHSQTVLTEFNESIKNRIEKGLLMPGQAEMICRYDDVIHKSQGFARILLSSLGGDFSEYGDFKTVNFKVKTAFPANKRIDLLLEDIKKHQNAGYRTIILAGARTRAERIASELFDRGFSAMYRDELTEDILPGQIVVSRGGLQNGFEYQEIKLLALTGNDIFGEEKVRKVKAKKKGVAIDSFVDLKIGDYVVHDNHGIGVYRGIEKIVSDNVSKDYLKISYADGGHLYIQTGQMDLIQKYIGGENTRPKISRLGGADWQKAKAKAKAGVQIMAKELIEIYAKRQAAEGFCYGPDTVWQREFEESFIYEETDDQINAIDDVKADMESRRVMDRLICGDVGYGKTEIAIRAAFKAVQDGKQVAYLVPTTILCEQHYHTFAERMADFPVTVASLSRFRTKKEQTASIEGLSKGKVDIVIGTHRLLSQDVRFRDLGLIIVDEEQRFGVAHKEKLKRLRENVDVLTLTATPIPRTLHMSLNGIRDMSILEEPPQERQPIQTYVMEYDQEFIREAVNRELVRSGQVYYLHNRVRNIAEIAHKIQTLVPEARVGFAHGQMTEHDLENVMVNFINRDIDVLVCTTIIETGLDIPNVNTIIIQDADFMGLSQLYQLRGRVGRSNRTSFAYLMYKRDKVLTEDSTKRLQTIREFTEFGSGFRIAMRDLEIRGAGNLLGAEQHGHMDAVGYDTFCRLLDEAVRELRGEPSKAADSFETLIDISLNAYIPDYFIENELQKLEIYKKISLIRTRDDYYAVWEEIEDRYGTLPAAVVTLLEVAWLRGAAHRIGITQITQKNKSLVAIFKPDASVDPQKIAETVTKHKGRLFFTIAQNPYLTLKTEGETEEEAKRLRDMLLEIAG